METTAEQEPCSRHGSKWPFESVPPWLTAIHKQPDRQHFDQRAWTARPAELKILRDIENLAKFKKSGTCSSQRKTPTSHQPSETSRVVIGRSQCRRSYMCGCCSASERRSQSDASWRHLGNRADCYWRTHIYRTAHNTVIMQPSNCPVNTKMT